LQSSGGPGSQVFSWQVSIPSHGSPLSHELLVVHAWQPGMRLCVQPRGAVQPSAVQPLPSLQSGSDPAMQTVP
jgi:hypothetical protein